MAGDNSGPTPRRKHASSSRRSSEPYRSRKRHDKSDDDEVATRRPPPTLDELRKSRVEYFSKSPEQRRKTMKYVYDQPVTSRSRVSRPEASKRRSSVQPSRHRKVGSGTKKKHSHKLEQHDGSDGERVYVVRPDLKESRTAQQTVQPAEASARKTSTRPSPSNNATMDRKPPQRRHTAPVHVVEVDDDQPK